MCFCRCIFCLNLRLHILHAKALSSVCDVRCLFRLENVLLLNEQCIHRWSLLSSVSVLTAGEKANQTHKYTNQWQIYLKYLNVGGKQGSWCYDTTYRHATTPMHIQCQSYQSKLNLTWLWMTDWFGSRADGFMRKPLSCLSIGISGRILI